MGECLSKEGRWFESNHGNYGHAGAQSVANKVNIMKRKINFITIIKEKIT